jgi:hypothetical protein
MEHSLPLSPTPKTFTQADNFRWLWSTWVALAVCFALAEVVELNRFLRSWLEGRNFWAYMGAYLGVLGALLCVGFLAFATRKLSVSGISLIGIFAGLLSSVIALSMSSFLLGRGIQPTLNAWRDPVQVVIFAMVSLSWLFGGVVALVTYAIVRRSYRHLLYLLLGSVAIKGLGLMLGLFSQRFHW